MNIEGIANSVDSMCSETGCSRLDLIRALFYAGIIDDKTRVRLVSGLGREFCGGAFNRRGAQASGHVKAIEDSDYKVTLTCDSGGIGKHTMAALSLRCAGFDSGGIGKHTISVNVDSLAVAQSMHSLIAAAVSLVK
jgi:hypothetical protein